MLRDEATTEPRPAGAAIVGGVIQFFGWLCLFLAISLVLLFGSVTVTGFRYNGF